MTNEKLLSIITAQAEEIGTLREQLRAASQGKIEKREVVIPAKPLGYYADDIDDMTKALLQFLETKPNKILLIKGLRSATRISKGEALYLGDCKEAVEKFLPF